MHIFCSNSDARVLEQWAEKRFTLNFLTIGSALVGVCVLVACLFVNPSLRSWIIPTNYFFLLGAAVLFILSLIGYILLKIKALAIKNIVQKYKNNGQSFTLKNNNNRLEIASGNPPLGLDKVISMHKSFLQKRLTNGRSATGYFLETSGSFILPIFDDEENT
ncbi:MAG: hypothetical protein IPO14_06240 [Saprospiraceae bacterium]|nr:hypothetical protein [Saprospiraceae bacterium]